MPVTEHVERHFTAAESVRDIVIGMSDGLTVPFALAAGLAGAVDTTSLVVVAGLAEIAAGSIAMGLGGYLAGKTDVEHYAHERQREIRETETLPQQEHAEVAAIFRGYGLPPEQVQLVTDAIASDRTRWVDFMMRFELGLEEPDPNRARQSALNIGLSYVAGGLIPLLPYIVLDHIRPALVASVGLTLAALALFGGIKARFTGIGAIRGAVQTTLVGGLAAGAAFTIARLIG